MLKGAKVVLDEDGCALSGGHTTEGKETGLGFSVQGYLLPGFDGFLKGDGSPGDVIILTKSLGTGALWAADMRVKCDGVMREKAIAEMLKSNGKASKVLVEERQNVTAVTDCTGFGFMGHLLEMLGEGLGAEIDLEALSFYRGGLKAAGEGIFSSLQESNESSRRTVKNHVEAAKRGGVRYKLMFDPQTSGGLIVFAKKDAADRLVELLKGAGYDKAGVVGRVVEDTGGGGREGEGEGEVCQIRKNVRVCFD